MRNNIRCRTDVFPVNEQSSTISRIDMPDGRFYESHDQPPLSRRAFYRRMLRHGGVVGILVAGSVVLGTAGYHWLGEARWIDAFLNACMLLGGMGPVGEIPNAAGKIFAALFALYAGLVFLVSATIIITPVVHRLIHRMHWDSAHGGRGR